MTATSFEPGQRIDHTAADWWARLRDPAVSDRTLEQWTAWLEADPRHGRAFERASALAEALAAAPADVHRDFVHRFTPRRYRASRHRASRWTLAAGVAALAVLGAGTWLAVRGDASATRPYESAIGAHRDIDLPDGSSIELGGATALTTRYDRNERAVDLEHGEAFFHIAHAERPFVVNAGPLRIRDLGTAFNVRRTGDRVTVTVTEGRVRVSPVAQDGTDAGTVELGAGREASFDPETHAMRLLDVDGEHAAAWRSRRLEFVNEPMDAVLANVNRYAARPIRLADPSLARLTFTGTVQVDTIDSWVAALPRVFPVHVGTFADRVELTRQTSVTRSAQPR
jgi:transmembrane sensor